jgi:Uncharacterized proteins, LmbE homologs
MGNGIRLVLTPHMDDEVIGMGGTIAYLVKSGYQVVVVYLTDGAAAYEGKSPPRLRETTILLKTQVGSRRGLRHSGMH